MSKPNPGLDLLFELAEDGQYHAGLSYSCIKEFSPSYPKKEPIPFIADDLPKATGIFKYGTDARNRT